jgi:transcriptional regulator with XRE-family HTH domain
MSPGERIRMLRIILGISREDFCKKYCINFNTLTSIELDRLKISAKQLGKIIDAFVKEGLYIGALWIMEAKGTPPTRMLPANAASQDDFLGTMEIQSFIKSRATTWSHFIRAMTWSVVLGTLLHTLCWENDALFSIISMFIWGFCFTTRMCFPSFHPTRKAIMPMCYFP